jgi:PAS domain S-box-containing protein
VQTEQFRTHLGLFVTAVETTRMPMVFTDGQDAQHPIIYANDAFLALTGYTRAALLGAPISRLVGESADCAAAASIAAALAVGMSGKWVLAFHGADDRVFPASVTTHPARDADQNVRYNCLSLFEVRRMSDVAGRRSFSDIARYDHMPGFISLTEGPDHRFTYANLAYKRLVGQPSLVGRTVIDTIPEWARLAVIDRRDEVYRTGDPFVAKAQAVIFVHPDTGVSEKRFIDFVYQPLRDIDGVVTGIFCEGYDVTAEHKTADELSALQAEMIYHSRINAMGTMATMLGHELNQPLNVISNYAAGMQAIINPATADADRLANALQGIEEAAQRAGDIIHNLRDLTRRRLADKAVFGLKPAVDDCIRLVRMTTPPGIRLVNTIADGITVLAHKVQIQQVIINLLINAYEAMAMTGHHHVTIFAREERDLTIIGVRDQGPGVPVESAADLFSWHNSSKTGGMGLGLPICRTIVEAHQGRIWLDKNSAAGAEICFSLPRTPA